MSLTVIPGGPKVSTDAETTVGELLEEIKSGRIRSVCYVALTDDGCVFGVGGEDELLTLLGSTHLLSQQLSDILNSISDER